MEEEQQPKTAGDVGRDVESAPDQTTTRPPHHGGHRGGGGGGGRRGRRGGGGGRGRPRAEEPSIAENLASANKKPRKEVPKDSPILALFQSYATVLDEVNDRHERLVKVSRDVTIGSKRLIFLLQRNDERSALIQQAEIDLTAILANIEKIAAELEGHEYWQYRRAFSPGLQEFIEAISFLHFVKYGTVITRTEIEEVIHSGSPNHVHFFVNDEDYLLGIAGELMRKAIGAINAGEVEMAYAIRSIMQAIYEGFQQLSIENKGDLKQKLGVMEGSVKKVENACLAVCVQGVEKLALLGAPVDD